MQSIISNNLYQKNVNIALIAQLVWKKPGIARADIARELNLYRSTVTNITNYLIDNGVIVEGSERSSQSHGGRKAITLSLNPSIGIVAGFDLQPSHYRATLIDIYGKTIWSEIGNTPDAGFDAIIDFLMDKVIGVSNKLSLSLLGVCFGVPGVVDGERGIVKYAEPLKLYDYDFYKHFKAKYPYFVIIENDANCTAWYEMVNSKDIQSDLIALYGDYHESNNQFDDRNGVGIGIGIAIDGKVYHGAHSSAGEFCSVTWNKEMSGQSGISNEELSRTQSDLAVWEKWVGDIFLSLVPVVSVIDPKYFYMIGKPFADKDSMLATIKRKAPAFLDVLEKYGVELVFDSSDEMAVAEGAARMYLQNMFSIPELSKIKSVLSFDWDSMIKNMKARQK